MDKEDNKQETTSPFPNPNVQIGAEKVGWGRLDKQINWGKLKGDQKEGEKK
jgi:hypothetical protein